MMLDAVVLTLNGKPVPGKVDRTYDLMTKMTYINLDCPKLEAAARLLVEVEQAVSLDHVMFNWHREVL